MRSEVRNDEDTSSVGGAGVSDEEADDASSVIINLEAEMKVIKWMCATNTALVIALIGIVFAKL